MSQKVIRCPDDKLALLLEHGGLNCTSEAKAVAHGIMLDLRDCRAALAAAEDDALHWRAYAEAADIKLADERRHADALEDAAKPIAEWQSDCGWGVEMFVECKNEMIDMKNALAAHAARRAAEKSHVKQRWECRTCGLGVSADEDGCCATCGAECEAQEVKP